MLPRATTQGAMWLDAMGALSDDLIGIGAEQAGRVSTGASVWGTVGRGPPYAGLRSSLFALWESRIPNPEKERATPQGRPFTSLRPTLNAFDGARTYG